MGKYTSLDEQIVEMVIFMRKNGVQRLVMTDGGIEIEFQDMPAKKNVPVWGRDSYNDTTSDETSYYSMDKDKN